MLPISHLVTFSSAILPSPPHTPSVTFSAIFLSHFPQPSSCHLPPQPSSCHFPLSHLPIIFPFTIPCHVLSVNFPLAILLSPSTQIPYYTPSPVTSLSPSPWPPTSSQLPSCHPPSSHPVPHSCTYRMAGSVAQLPTCLISMSYLR